MISMHEVIDKTSPEPLYIQVQNWIKGKIAAGDWSAKEKIPSEADLAEELNVSRGTIKQAIKLLINEDILMQIHGKGTFVIGEKLDYPLAERLISVAETMIENKKHFRTKLNAFEKMPIPKDIQKAFQLVVSEEVYYIQRIRYFEDTPVVLLENYLPVKHFPDLERYNLEESTLFSIIEDEYKFTIDWGKRSFIAKVVENPVAEMLQVSKGMPIIFLEQTTYTTGDVPIEYSRVSIRSDQIRLTSILKRKV